MQLQIVLCYTYDMIFITQILKSSIYYIWMQGQTPPPKEKFWVRTCQQFLHMYVQLDQILLFCATADILPGDEPVSSGTCRRVACFVNIQYHFESVTV
jgi:hypothetical protein